MKALTYYLSILFVAFSISSCSNANKSKQSDSSFIISEVLDQDTYMSKLEQAEKIQLVDVRTPEEFTQGTIGSAINIDYEADDFKAKIVELDRNRQVYIFCQSGNRSGQAAKVMAELGFKEIYDLDGGYGEWSDNQN